MKSELGELIRIIRTKKDLSLRELSDRTGLSHSYLHNLEIGIDPRTGNAISPSIPTLEKLAAGIDVPLNELLVLVSDDTSLIQRAGRISRSRPQEKQQDVGISEQHPEMACEVTMDNIRMVPVLGKIAAGEPIFEENSIEDWMPVDSSISRIYGEDLNQYYYLRIHGSSMEPMFNDCDLVLVRQGRVDDGEIAVVLCTGENACVKKIQYLQEQELLILISRNPAYPPVTKPMADCQVIGKVVLRIGEPRW